MTQNPESRFTVLSFLWIVILLSGCVHQKYVSEPYPAWGEENSLQRSDHDTSFILRVLYPADIAHAKACMLLVHGMNEHIGRYGEVAHYFANRGFIVGGFDYYAHGLANPVLQQANEALKSGAEQVDISDAFLSQAGLGNLEPARKDFGFALEKTIERCDAQSEFKRPVFIVAHSLGALVTATYLQQNQNDITQRVKGTVFLGPGFAVSEVPGWRGWLANPVIKLSFHAETHFLHPHDEPLPLMVLNQIVAFLTVPILDGVFEVFSWPGLRTLFTPVTPGWVVDYLTDSETEKNRIRNDSWIVKRTLLRYAKGIEEEIVGFRRQMSGYAIPYYLIFSGHDPITPAWGSRDFIDATYHNHADNGYYELPDSQYHQHLFLTNPRRREILEHIDQWLNRRMTVGQNNF